MSKPTSLKQNIHVRCNEVVAARLQSFQQTLKELKESAGNETKSSAGDKYETGRAMLHIEQENVRRQMAEVLAQKAALDRIDPDSRHEKAGAGSLVKAGTGYYFLSIALGKMVIDGHAVITLSPQSPLGSRLVGLKTGDQLVMNEKEITITGIE